jgi:hypothetical protein
MKGKGSAALLIALGGGKKKPSGMMPEGEDPMTEDSEEESYEVEAEAAMEAFAAALKGGDVKAQVAAFRDLMEVC